LAIRDILWQYLLEVRYGKMFPYLLEGSMIQKLKALIAVCVVSLFLAGAVPARALDRDHDRDDRKCEQRIHKAEERLRQAERKHGEHSRQAEQARHQLEEARERCHHGDRDHDHH
jgi:hypothetical protein